jgi:hypothetical protein
MEKFRLTNARQRQRSVAMMTRKKVRRPDPPRKTAINFDRAPLTRATFEAGIERL